MTYTIQFVQDSQPQQFQTNNYREYFTTYWQLMTDQTVTHVKKPKKIPKLS